MELYADRERPYALFTAIPFIGHLNPLLRQADELSARGWSVSLAAFETVRFYVEKNFPKIEFISLGQPPASVEAAEAMLERVCAEKSWLKSTMMLLEPLELFWSTMFDALLTEVNTRRPDVMVIDFVSTAGLDVAELKGIPFVINNPDLLTVLPATLLPFSASAPQLFSGHSVHRMGVRQKISAYLSRCLAIAVAQITINRRTNKLRSTKGLMAIDNLRRLRGRKILVNCAFGLEYRRPIPSHIKMVGPMLSKAMESLPSKWGEWLEDGPVVYVNLGTLSSPSARQLQQMSAAFGSLPCRVLWVMREKVRVKLPNTIHSNIRIENWVPSPLAILKHSNVKAFVSHCGVNSVHESIQAGTPIVAIPMFAAQKDMGIRLKDAGIGILLEKETFKSSELTDALTRVMSDQSFKDKILVLQESFIEAGGIKQAANLIEEEANIAVQLDNLVSVL